MPSHVIPKVARDGIFSLLDADQMSDDLANHKARCCSSLASKPSPTPLVGIVILLALLSHVLMDCTQLRAIL
jgi:hypothetical protein